MAIDQDGKLVSIFGERGTSDAQFNFPEGLAVASSGLLCLADRENNRIQVRQLTDDMPVPCTSDVDKFTRV